MIHGIPEIVAFASDIWTLLPGDLILTGTPAGLGGFVDGQTVDITIEGIGTLSNPARNRVRSVTRAELSAGRCCSAGRRARLPGYGIHAAFPWFPWLTASLVFGVILGCIPAAATAARRGACSRASRCRRVGCCGSASSCSASS